MVESIGIRREYPAKGKCHWCQKGHWTIAKLAHSYLHYFASDDKQDSEDVVRVGLLSTKPFCSASRGRLHIVFADGVCVIGSDMGSTV